MRDTKKKSDLPVEMKGIPDITDEKAEPSAPHCELQTMLLRRKEKETLIRVHGLMMDNILF